MIKVATFILSQCLNAEPRNLARLILLTTNVITMACHPIFKEFWYVDYVLITAVLSGSKFAWVPKFLKKIQLMQTSCTHSSKGEWNIGK